MSFRFAHPEYFYVLWALPAVVFVTLWLYRKSEKKIRKVLGERLSPFLLSSLSMTRRKWKIALEVLAVVFFIFALARPQMGATRGEVKSEGIELILAVDVSSSMLTEDIKPSRLEFAKSQLTRLMEKLPGDKVGIVAFAGSAALVAPMTTDKAALEMFLDSLSPDSVQSQGTEFKKALIESAEAFKRGGIEGDEETVVSKVILFASDGEDNEKGALEEAKEVADSGVKIFSLAFGTEKGGPIPIYDSNKNMRGYKRDASGKVILSQTKGTALRELAKVGGGSFYHATFGTDAVSAIVEDFSKLEQAAFDTQVYTSFGERYQWFILIGLFLSFVELFLGERKPAGRIWKGRFEVSEN